MHPELIPGFPIKTYGVCMAIGFLMAWQVIACLCRRTGRTADPLSNLLVLMMVSGVVGARIAYVVEHWASEFAAHPLSCLYVWQGGLMFYGGLILAVVVFVVWTLVKREKFLPLADLFAVVIPLGHAFGRIGCFFYGCCYGRETASAFGVAFPHGSPAWYEQVHAGRIAADAVRSLPVLPTQLFEAAAVACLFCILFVLYRRFAAVRAGLVTGAYFVGYAFLRFGMELLRGDPRAAIGPFSIGQAISLGLLILGCVFILVAFRPKKS